MNTDQSTLFTELVKAADEQVQMTLEQMCKLNTEVTAAAQVTGHNLEARIAEVERQLLLALAQSGEKTLTHIEALKKDSDEVRLQFALVTELIRKQDAMMQRVVIYVSITTIAAIALLVVLLVR